MVGARCDADAGACRRAAGFQRGRLGRWPGVAVAGSRERRGQAAGRLRPDRSLDVPAPTPQRLLHPAGSHHRDRSASEHPHDRHPTQSSRPADRHHRLEPASRFQPRLTNRTHVPARTTRRRSPMRTRRRTSTSRAASTAPLRSLTIDATAGQTWPVWAEAHHLPRPAATNSSGPSTTALNHRVRPSWVARPAERDPAASPNPARNQTADGCARRPSCQRAGGSDCAPSATPPDSRPSRPPVRPVWLPRGSRLVQTGTV